jgi:hypothetical protein
MIAAFCFSRWRKKDAAAFCYLLVIVWQIMYSKWDIDPHFILSLE